MFGQKDNITAALSSAYKAMYEKKELTREKWVPESITDEDVADFMGAAAAAAKAGKKEFKFGDKTYKVTMKKDVAKKIDEAEVDVCEECGKVHEGSCASAGKEESKDVKEQAEDYTPAYDDENEDDELVPRPEGEKAFYDAHIEAGEVIDAQDIIDATFDTIKKSGPKA